MINDTIIHNIHAWHDIRIMQDVSMTCSWNELQDRSVVLQAPQPLSFPVSSFSFEFYAQSKKYPEVQDDKVKPD